MILLHRTGAVAKAAGEAAITLAFEASATSSDETITAPSEIQAGDLLVLVDGIEQSDSDPGETVPSGFTIAQSDVNDFAGFVFYRMILSYKIADGSEADSSLTGMNALTVEKVLAVFRPSIPLTSASHSSGGIQLTGSSPSDQSVQASNGSSPLVVLAGYFVDEGSIDPRGFSPAKDNEVNVSDNGEIWLAWRIYNTSPQDTTISMEDDGTDQNGLASTYIEVS